MRSCATLFRHFMKPDRLFYSASGGVFLLLLVIGFRHFLLTGMAMGGDDINPVMFRLDATHGIAACPIQGPLLALSGFFRWYNGIVAVISETPRSSFA